MTGLAEGIDLVRHHDLDYRNHLTRVLHGAVFCGRSCSVRGVAIVAAPRRPGPRGGIAFTGPAKSVLGSALSDRCPRHDAVMPSHPVGRGGMCPTWCGCGHGSAVAWPRDFIDTRR